jgi:hypothetical protein
MTGELDRRASPPSGSRTACYPTIRSREEIRRELLGKDLSPSARQPRQADVLL